MTTTRRTPADLPLLDPGEDGFDAARQAYNLSIDQRPAAVAVPRDEREVASAIRFAREAGLRVAPQRTGHNAAPLGDLADTVLLKTDAMTGVALDAERQSARVQAGSKWEDLVPRASEMGLAALHGSTPDVSIAGYTLGGGLSWYGRKHGFAANSVSAIELVTADGEHRRADHENEPELFWALRGGGGSFGVVTALEFRLFPVSEVYAGAMFFPIERASEVLHAWHEYDASMPDEMNSIARIMRFPPFEEVPEPVRGKAFAIVDAAFLGSEADGTGLMRPLRELGPVMDTFGMVPPVGLSELHMDPPDPVPYESTHALLGELPAEAIDEMVAVGGVDSGSPLIVVELRPTRGALGRGGPHHGAADTLPGSHLMFAVGMTPPEPEMVAAVRTQLALVDEAFSPYAAGHYLSFVEEPIDPTSFHSEDTHRRLQAVKAQYDPDELIRANHPIHPA